MLVQNLVQPFKCHNTACFVNRYESLVNKPKQGGLIDSTEIERDLQGRIEQRCMRGGALHLGDGEARILGALGAPDAYGAEASCTNAQRADGKEPLETGQLPDIAWPSASYHGLPSSTANTALRESTCTRLIRPGCPTNRPSLLMPQFRP